VRILSKTAASATASGKTSFGFSLEDATDPSLVKPVANLLR
jgi:hypothetical protein